MADKRGARRRHLLGEVKLKPLSGGRWVKAVVTNINSGGIGLYSTGTVKKRDKVSVKLSYLRDGKPTEVEEITGKVCWVKSIGNSSAAGIMFQSKVTKRDYPILSKCLEYARGVK
jgi:hypothetical protein